MPLVNVGIGVSQKDNLIEAAKEAAQRAKKELGDKKPKLLLFFCTYTYPQNQYQKAQEEVYRIFGDKEIPLVGGSTLGFFAKDKYFFDISLFGKTMGWVLKTMGKVFKPFKFTGAGVVALESDFLKIGTGLGRNAFKDPRLAGEIATREALDNIRYNPQTTSGFLISPGCTKLGRFFDSEILKGITSVLESFRVQGGGLCGGASEQMIFTGPAFYKGKVYKESLILVLLDSKLAVGYGVNIGSEIIDKVGLVTKVKDKWTIEEINRKPAAEVLFKAVKKHIDIKKEKFYDIPAIMGLKGYLLVSLDVSGDFFWPNLPARIIDGKCVEAMNSGIEKGMLLALAKGTKESCIEATEKATKLMIEDAMSKDFGFVMFFSCAARGIIMGKDYFNEIKQIKDTLGDKNLPIFGICSNGEQAFHKKGFPVASSYIIATTGISNRFLSKLDK